MGSTLPPAAPDSAPDASPGPEMEPAAESGPESEPEPDSAPEPEPAPKPEQPKPRRRPASRRRRRWKLLLIWGSASLAVLLAVIAGLAYAAVRHFDGNLRQDDIRGLLGSQPVDTHPKAENILLIGSDSRQGLGKQYGSGLVTDQSDTMMIIHIPASRQWAEVMSIPRDSWVNIPACREGNGQLSQPTQFKINESFALGNLYGNHTEFGVACTVKTVEQDTGIYLDHFIVVSFTGFKDMVSALGGVYECNPTPISDPNSHLNLTAGKHLLTPVQALGYVRARYTLGDGSDLERIDRQQAFMSSLVHRVESKLLNPLAIYRFLDAATRSLTIDSQLGGVSGLYNLGQSLRGIPSDKIAFFTVPNEYDPENPADVIWTQPEDSKIFASFRDDVPASKSLFAVQKQSKTKATGAATAQPTSNAAKPRPAASAATPAATPSATGSSLKIQARTADQSICAG
jgi:LCP family protein required for cell wall assembly